MLTSCLAYAVLSNPVEAAFKWTIDRHSLLNSARINFVSETPTLKKKVAVNRISFAYIRPNDVSLSIRQTDGTSPSRDFYLDRQALTVFDAATRQYKRKKVASTVSVRDAILDELQVDELVLSVFDEGGIENYLKPLRLQKPWKYSAEGNNILLTYSKPGAVFKVGIDGRTGFMNKMVIGTGATATVWKIAVQPQAPKNLAFVAPANSYPVSDFDPKIHEPKYANAQAEAITKKMFKAYDRPAALAYEVNEGGKKTMVWFKPGAIRQRDPAIDFTMKGGHATLLDLSKKVSFAGRAQTVEMIEAVGETGSRIEPNLRALMRGANPYRLLLGENCRVAVKGKMDLDGKQCTILEADNEVALLSLIVRNSDGLVLSVSSELKTKEGQRTAGSTRIIRYLPVGSIKSGEAFALKTPPGFGSRPIKEIVPNMLG